MEQQLEGGGKLTGLAAELDRLRRLHRRVLSDLPMGACALDGDGTLRLWNQRLARLSGIDEERVVGLGVSRLPHPWSELLGSFLSLHQSHLYRIRQELPTGARWLNLHKESVGLDPGDQGHVVLIEDLTEQRMLEAELAHRERLASIGTFAAGIAHEIGNPLTGISTLAQNLRLESEDMQVREAIDEILNQGRRIRDIVSSLLTFSRAEDPAMPVTSRIELGDLLAQAVRLTGLSRRTSDVYFRMQVDPDIGLWAERERLLQALVNLLVNAVDASPPAAGITVRGNGDGRCLELVIEDQGPGIPEDLRERVFEPFFTTKTPGRGTGLGLPLAYGIIHDHGGDIQLEARSGGGTRARIRLPLSPQPNWSTP